MNRKALLQFTFPLCIAFVSVCGNAGNGKPAV